MEAGWELRDRTKPARSGCLLLLVNPYCKQITGTMSDFIPMGETSDPNRASQHSSRVVETLRRSLSPSTLEIWGDSILGGGRVLEVSRRYSGLVIRDLSLPSSTVSPNALVNSYDIEDTALSITDNIINFDINTKTDNDAVTNNSDANTGGWLSSNKRAHRHAIAQHLATSAVEKPPTSHPRVSVELARTTLETKASDEPSAGAGGGSCGSLTHCVDSSLGECVPEATFLERCGRALDEKRSFWRK
ncbi:hypothetical protein CIB48_g4396, partial [Xylaria polymorpha]